MVPTIVSAMNMNVMTTTVLSNSDPQLHNDLESDDSDSYGTNDSVINSENNGNDTDSCSMDPLDHNGSVNDRAAVPGHSSLFIESSLSTHNFSVALLSIVHRHSLTNSCVTDMLKLLHHTLPSPNGLPKSYQTLLCDFVDYKGTVALHECCGYCTRLLESGSSCSITECQMANVSSASFIEIKLDKQLQKLFSGMPYSYLCNSGSSLLWTF